MDIELAESVAEVHGPAGGPIYVLCGVEGSVTVEAVDPTRRRAELRFSWY